MDRRGEFACELTQVGKAVLQERQRSPDVNEGNALIHYNTPY